MSHVDIQVQKINIDIVVLETPAEDFGWEVTRPQGALSETVPPLVITKANEEVLKYVTWTVAGRICDMPPRLINIEHFGDNLAPNYWIYWKGETRPQLKCWYIKIMESTINTVILKGQYGSIVYSSEAV